MRASYLDLKPITESEKHLMYRPVDIKNTNALVGYLRGDFTNEESFFYTWFDNNQSIKNDIFKREFDTLVNALRSTVLESFTSMKKYCEDNRESAFQGNYTCESGFSVESDSYFYAKE